MEGILMPLMYEIPSDKTITKVIVTGESVRGDDVPTIERGERKRLSAP